MKCLSVLLLFSLISCGTLRSPKKIVPVDSSPRGIDVFYKGKNIGTTPFFHQVDNGQSHTYSFYNNKEKIDKNYQCPFNWGQSVLPSSLVMLLYPVGTVFGVVGLTTDYFSGSLFRCQKTFTFTTKLSNLPKNFNSHILLPPVSPHTLGEFVCGL